MLSELFAEIDKDIRELAKSICVAIPFSCVSR